MREFFEEDLARAILKVNWLLSSGQDRLVWTGNAEVFSVSDFYAFKVERF